MSCQSPVWVPQGNSGDPNFKPPDDEGNGNDNDSNYLNPSSVHTPEPEPKDPNKTLIKALTQLVELVDSDRQEALKIHVKEPDQFDGSEQWKLWGFLLQLKLNFQAKRKLFQSDSDKVNYALSFLNRMALNYF